jgi:hypothetical protein
LISLLTYECILDLLALTMQAVSAESEQYRHHISAPSWQEQLRALQQQQAQQQLAFGGLGGGFDAAAAQQRHVPPGGGFAAGASSFARALQQQLAQAGHYRADGGLHW